MAKHRKQHRSNGFKLPVAVIAGFAPLTLDGINGYRRAGFSGIMENVTQDLTGYSIPQGQWSASSMVRGWFPILAGIVAHKLAGVFGINAALGRAHVPLLRI